MNELFTKEQVLDILKKHLTQDNCQQTINFSSMRPPPNSPEGKAWEMCLNFATYAINEHNNK